MGVEQLPDATLDAMSEVSYELADIEALIAPQLQAYRLMPETSVKYRAANALREFLLRLQRHCSEEAKIFLLEQLEALSAIAVDSTSRSVERTEVRAAVVKPGPDGEAHAAALVASALPIPRPFMTMEAAAGFGFRDGNTIPRLARLLGARPDISSRQLLQIAGGSPDSGHGVALATVGDEHLEGSEEEERLSVISALPTTAMLSYALIQRR